MLKSKKNSILSYNKDIYVPVLKCSICTGEMVAGFKEINTGKFIDDMYVSGDKDIDKFKKKYGITDTLEKIY